MNTQLLLPLVLTTMVVVVGWIVGHHLSASPDRENKRREKLTEFLIDAYRRIEKYPCRQLSPDNAADFESAIADIQLFGSPYLVQLAQSVAEDIPKSGVAQADQLLLELRKVLRKELA